MTDITKPMIQIGSLDGDVPMIFGGAGHANHVGFVQTAHLYDEDLSEAGSDRDDLEDLERDRASAMGGAFRSSFKGSFKGRVPNDNDSFRRVPSGGASVVSHRSATHQSVVSRASRRSGATDISGDRFWKSYSHVKAHNARMHSAHGVSRAGFTKAAGGNTVTISRATCPAHNMMENLGVSSLMSTILMAGPDHSPLFYGKQAAAGDAITRNFMDGESQNYASVSCMGNAAHSHDDIAHDIFDFGEEDDDALDDVPVRRSGHTAVRRPTTTFTGAPPASYGQMLGFSASQGTRGIASDIMGFI